MLQSIEFTQPEAREHVRSISEKIFKLGKVIVVTGAGISVASGIPDFRSADGLYNRVILGSNERDLLKGKDMFDTSSFHDPKTRPLFLRFIAELKDSCDGARPSTTHKFIKQLARRSLLLRNYTQNIDNLERQVGLTVYDGGCEDGRNGSIVESVGVKRRESFGGSHGDRPHVIPLHGTLSRAACTVCHDRVPLGDDLLAAFKRGDLVECRECKARSDERASRGRRRLHSGFYRPDIVLYNEHHPMGDCIADFIGLDVASMPSTLIVMGTSLRVPGLKKLVKDIAKTIQQKRAASPDRAGHIVFINKTPASRSEWRTVFDMELLGDCDAWTGAMMECIEEMSMAAIENLDVADHRPSPSQSRITNFFRNAKGVAAKSGKKQTLLAAEAMDPPSDDHFVRRGRSGHAAVKLTA